MFKNKYKACFDDIKGDESLLAEILAEVGQKNSKRISFTKISRYTASAAAALVVVVSSAFLYNSGLLKADSPSEDLSKALSVQSKISTQNEDIASSKDISNSKTSNNTAEKAVVAENAAADKDTNEIEKNKITKEQSISERENNVIVQNKAESVQPASGAEESFVSYSEDNTIAETTAEEGGIAENPSNSENAEISVASLEPENSEESAADITTDKAQAKAYSGGGGGSSARSISENTESEVDQRAGKKVRGISPADFDVTLNIFKEGILSIPESEYISQNEKTLIYSNEDKTKRIEIGFSLLKPESEENFAVVELDGGYLTIKSENISEEYISEIVSEFIDK